MPSIIPKQITSEIRKFCQSINPNESPIFVPVRAETDAIQNDCFFNVRRKIEREGGSIVNGWRVAMWPGVFIEAEHHAIWQASTGALVDVSSPPVPAKQVLFIRDDNKNYDEINHRRLDNIRHPLVNDKAVYAFLKSAGEKYEFIERHSVGKTGQVELPKEYIEIERKHNATYAKVLYKYLSPNDLCVCGSGRKIKRCHGLDNVRESCRELF